MCRVFATLLNWGLREYGNGEGGIGLEPTLAEWLANMVDVMGEVWRVLRDDGVVWLNLGDAYAGSWGAQSRYRDDNHNSPVSATQIAAHPRGVKTGSLTRLLPGLKPKDLIGQPWRLAFALQDAGWYLRSDIIWAKPNPMPESVQDRPTKSHEYVFLLTKRPKYFYDAEAIREQDTAGHGSGQMQRKYRQDYGGPINSSSRQAHAVPWERVGQGRNKRTVWTIATQPFPGSHFATMPPALVEPCILAGTSAYGCCGACGAPWVRVVERTGEWRAKHDRKAKHNGEIYRTNPGGGIAGINTSRQSTTTGWQRSCYCSAGVIPCTVLDMFGGAGTTALVADRLGRDAISIELNPEYHAMGQTRVLDEAPLLHASVPENGTQYTLTQESLF